MMQKTIIALNIVIYLFFGCTAQNAVDNNTPKTNIKTLSGSSVQVINGQDRASVYGKINESFGPLDILRVFCESEKDKKILWPNWLPKSKSAVISFKLLPSEILGGQNDQVLKDFFASLPSDKKVWWCYYHEPEDNIKNGEFTAADYRNASDYIIRLKKSLHRDSAIATAILMTYTLKPEAKLNWRDYIPSLVECIAWDGYHRGWSDVTSQEIFAAARAVALETGIPWAVAEIGVNRYNKKDAQGNITLMDVERRKKLLNDMATYLFTVTPKPQFVTYFNSVGANNVLEYDWVIWDQPGLVAAWKAGIK